MSKTVRFGGENMGYIWNGGCKDKKWKFVGTQNTIIGGFSGVQIWTKLCRIKCSSGITDENFERWRKFCPTNIFGRRKFCPTKFCPVRYRILFLYLNGEKESTFSGKGSTVSGKGSSVNGKGSFFIPALQWDGTRPFAVDKHKTL